MSEQTPYRYFNQIVSTLNIYGYKTSISFLKSFWSYQTFMNFVILPIKNIPRRVISHLIEISENIYYFIRYLSKDI